METALLAGGCFWCIESAFFAVHGVVSTRAGYTGGSLADPSYREVCQGDTGHYEAIEITFDPLEISFLQLLDTFWRHIDPLDAGGQFADRGPQYRTAIFYLNAQQRRQALESKADVQALFPEPVVTQILPAQAFFVAEKEHQLYCTQKPEQYRAYAGGHLGRLTELWQGKRIVHDDLRAYLTPQQYHVAIEEGTEPPFENVYCDHKAEGIYVDVISGQPLFASVHKFDSGTGWPSFTESLIRLTQLEDWKLGTPRTEVRGPQSNAHLGHLFPDGPTGTRYCINSAALRFIPKERLVEEGYAELLGLF